MKFSGWNPRDTLVSGVERLADRASRRTRASKTFIPTLLALMVLVLFNSVAQAQGSSTHKILPPVVVTTTPFENRSELDLAQPVSVLRGDDLRRKREASLGDTVSRELGVASTSFGPGAGRPIIRGLDGPRVRVLENGVGTLDISSVSPDHAVTAESLNASQIEILRGPATLLYGSGASGGVVNVVNGRIPSQLFKSPKGDFEVGAILQPKNVRAPLTHPAALGGHSWSVGGFKRKTDDYHIPGWANEGDLQQEKGVVENSAVNSGGWSCRRIFCRRERLSGCIGLRVWIVNMAYPLPRARRSISNRHAMICQASWMSPLRGFERLKVRMGYNDYKHNEIESTGEIATRFKNQALESRAELLHDPIANWQGRIRFSIPGSQFFRPGRGGAGAGYEIAFRWTVPGRRAQLGSMAPGTRRTRIERATQNPQKISIPHAHSISTTSSAGALWKFMDGYGLGLTGTRGQRAPPPKNCT